MDFGLFFLNIGFVSNFIALAFREILWIRVLLTLGYLLRFFYQFFYNIDDNVIIGNSGSEDLFLSFYFNKNLFNEFEFKYYRLHLSNFLKKNKQYKQKINYFEKDKLFKDADIILVSSNFRVSRKYSEDFDALFKLNEFAMKKGKKLVLTSTTPFFHSTYIHWLHYKKIIGVYNQ